MLWAEWAAAATLPMTRGAACNKIAAVTNLLSAASLRGRPRGSSVMTSWRTRATSGRESPT